MTLCRSDVISFLFGLYVGIPVCLFVYFNCFREHDALWETVLKMTLCRLDVVSFSTDFLPVLKNDTTSARRCVIFSVQTSNFDRRLGLHELASDDIASVIFLT
jgi:hypothetical protein